ncbi:MAG: hypothetical protein ACTHLW_08785 [Verrucomicrobiota bacterium]
MKPQDKNRYSFFQGWNLVKHLSWTACIVALCSGCTTTYKPTTDNPASLVIHGRRRGAFDWDTLNLVSIDQMTPRRPWSGSSPRKLDAGRHRLVLQYEGNRELFGLHMTAPSLVVVGDFEGGKRYDLNGEFADTEVTVFVVDTASGKLVSEKVSAPVVYYDPNFTAPIIVPTVVK